MFESLSTFEINLLSSLDIILQYDSKYFSHKWQMAWADPEGGQGVAPPPLKNHKKLGFLSNSLV